MKLHGILILLKGVVIEMDEEQPKDFHTVIYMVY